MTPKNERAAAIAAQDMVGAQIPECSEEDTALWAEVQCGGSTGQKSTSL